jgi:hypothetical protein
VSVLSGFETVLVPAQFDGKAKIDAGVDCVDADSKYRSPGQSTSDQFCTDAIGRPKSYFAALDAFHFFHKDPMKKKMLKKSKPGRLN